jgi:hypothetical protein
MSKGMAIFKVAIQSSIARLATPKNCQSDENTEGSLELGELRGSKVMEVNQRCFIEYVSIYARSSSTMEVCRPLCLPAPCGRLQ